MAKQLTYIQIIRNMIEAHIDHYVWDKGHHFADIVEPGIQLEKSDENTIYWTATIKVLYNTYEMHGFMDEFGRVFTSSISYERTRSDADEWWKVENQYTVNEFVYGDQLAVFTFDE